MLKDKKALVQIPECKYCKQRTHVCKHGRGKTKIQRYRCTSCNKTFQIKYIYDAYLIEQ